MDGRNTIIIMLQCRFHVPENRIHRLNGICNLLLSGLTDPEHEITPAYNAVEAQINTLGRCFSTDDLHNLSIIQEELWTMIVNWWDTAKWARQCIRIPIRESIQLSTEKEDLLSDLLIHIVGEVKNHFGQAHMNQYYKTDVLEALIQMHTNGRITDIFLKQRLPRNTKGNLNSLLEYYKRLSTAHGFGQLVDILLQLLLEKKNRNDSRHSNVKVQNYQLDCTQAGVQPSFAGYIRFRRLNIDPPLFNHYERLFRVVYQF